MERFKESVEDSLDKTTLRLIGIETTVQDQTMDVATAVQLERLEEVERAVLMLDPDAIKPQAGADDAPGPDDDAPEVVPELRLAEPPDPVVTSMSFDPPADPLTGS